MRIVFMLLVLTISFSLSGCNDSAKVDELAKENAAISAELRECRENQNNAALKEEHNKKAIESLNRVEDEAKNMKKNKF